MRSEGPRFQSEAAQQRGRVLQRQSHHARMAARDPADEELRAALPMPADILQTYVKRLLEKGLAEEVSGKLVVPTAVFTQPEMLQGTSELYESVVQMVTSMRAAGFSFGD